MFPLTVQGFASITSAASQTKQIRFPAAGLVREIRVSVVGAAGDEADLSEMALKISSDRNYFVTSGGSEAPLGVIPFADISKNGNHLPVSLPVVSGEQWSICVSKLSAGETGFTPSVSFIFEEK